MTLLSESTVDHPQLRTVRYVETTAGCDLDLSDNTNLWGSPPSAVRALAECASVSRYPSAYSDELKRELAIYAGVLPEMIVTGCGSDDILDSIIRAFGDPDDAIAFPEPTFTMIPVFAAVNRLSVAPIDPRKGDIADALKQSGAGLIYLCSPNNPTGGTLNPDVIEAVVRGARGIVIVDEAYWEFSGTSAVDLVNRYDNLVLTRTMSKAFGLAGLRVGYAIARPDCVTRIEAARGPYKITTASERVVIDVLRNDRGWMRARVGETIVNRSAFVAALTELGFRALDSQANFILLPVDNSARVERELRARGIAVRRFDALPGIGDAVRITIGPWNSMERCVRALRETAA